MNYDTGDIGNPDGHYSGKNTSDHNSSAGLVEERLSKLEYHQRDIINHVNQVTFLTCIACVEPVHTEFPLCEQCLKTLGKLSKAKSNAKILE